MANRSDLGKERSGDRAARPALQESTIALSESQIAQLEVPAEPPPLPPSRGSRVRRAVVPNDVSLWSGRIIGADELGAAVPPRRWVGLWLLSGAVAGAVLAGGLTYARFWWETRASTSMQEVVALAMPPAATAPAAAAANAAPGGRLTPPASSPKPSKPAAVRRTAPAHPAVHGSSKTAPASKKTVKRSKSVSVSKTTSKRTKRVTARKRITRTR